MDSIRIDYETTDPNFVKESNGIVEQLDLARNIIGAGYTHKSGVIRRKNQEVEVDNPSA